MSSRSRVVTVCWRPCASVHCESRAGFWYISASRGSGGWAGLPSLAGTPKTSSLSGAVLPCTGSGTSLAIRSPSAKGSPMTRTTSRITERALSEPKVMIWPTLSRPYLSRT